MSDSLRQTIRLMADGWELRGRSDGRPGGRGKLPPSYQLVRGDEGNREVRPVDPGPVKRLVSLRWVAEAGREGDETLYSLTASGRAEAAKPPAGTSSE